MEYEFNIINEPKTWFIDLDGTIVKHNGYKNGGDILIQETLEFFKTNIKPEDFVIITTAREKKYKKITEKFLKDNYIRFDKVLYGLPKGGRILINDKKPDGSITAVSININRNEGIPNEKI